MLEHITKLDIGFRNIADLAGDDGVIQIAVQMPTQLPFTEDLGFSDTSLMGHWIHLGSDIVGILREAYPSKSLLMVTAKDFISDFTKTLFIVAHAF